MTALGDFSPGDVLTAADMNAIGVWNFYTPTFSAISGTGFSVSLLSSAYTQVNEIVIFRCECRVTTPGTANGFLMSLPVTAYDVFSGYGYGRERSIGGWSLNGEIWNTSQGLMTKYDNGNLFVTNARLAFEFIYQAA